MALETATYISQLVATNPPGGDPLAQADDHLRLVKGVLQNQFPNLGAAAVTPTAVELNYVAGVTSAIQTQLGTKAPLASPTFTGTPAAPTAAAGTSTTQLATTAFVATTAFASALPAQTTNANKFVTTDGTNASWSLVPLATGVSGTLPVTNGGLGAGTFTDGGVLIGNGTGIVQVTTAGTLGQALISNGPGVDPTFQALPASSLVLLSTVTASASATVDVETTFSSTYDAYILVASGVVPSADSSTLGARLKVGGAYDTGSNYRWTVTTNGANSTSFASEVSATGTFIEILSFFDGSSGKHGNFVMQIYNPASTSLQKMVTWQGSGMEATASLKHNVGSGMNTSTSAMTGVRFYLTGGGTITSGKFRLYGVTNV